MRPHREQALSTCRGVCVQAQEAEALELPATSGPRLPAVPEEQDSSGSESEPETEPSPQAGQEAEEADSSEEHLAAPVQEPRAAKKDGGLVWVTITVVADATTGGSTVGVSIKSAQKVCNDTVLNLPQQQCLHYCYRSAVPAMQWCTVPAHLCVLEEVHAHLICRPRRSCTTCCRGTASARSGTLTWARLSSCA